MKNNSLFKSVISLVVTASVVLSLGVAAFAVSGVPNTSFDEGDTIEAGTIVYDDLGLSDIYLYDVNEEFVDMINLHGGSYEFTESYRVWRINEGINFYDLTLVQLEDPSASSSSLTPEQRRLLSVQSFVETLYERILGRTYDVTGRDYWVDQLMNHGATGSDVVRGFIASSEFATARGSTSSLVLELYSDLFNRVPSSAELANWTSALEKGASKDEILNYFLSSPEWADVCAFYGVNV